MSRVPPDQLNLSPHWHVDCRLVGELPEDSVIGTRFLINLFIGALTLAIVLWVSWLLYSDLSLRQSIHDWDKRIAEKNSEVIEIQRLQADYGREATRIEQAFELLPHPLITSQFILLLGRTRPDLMIIDKIERSPSSIVLRGSFSESSERASRVLGNYVTQLRADPDISPLFQDIVMTDFQRFNEEGRLNFEITFRFRPKS